MILAEYNKCVDEYADRLYRFVLKNVQREEDAKDIVQESFVRLWSKIDDVPAEKVKSYLFTTAYHTMIDMFRKEKRKTDFCENMEEDVTSVGNYSDLKEIMDMAVNKLPEIQRMVILLRDYEGYSYNEIAQIINLTESQVKVYIYRGRMFLKKYIGSIEAII